MTKQTRVSGTRRLRSLQLLAALGSFACGSTGLPTDLPGATHPGDLSDPVVGVGVGGPVSAVDGGTAGSTRNGQGGVAGSTKPPVAGSGGTTVIPGFPMHADAGAPPIGPPPMFVDGGVPSDLQPCLMTDTFYGQVVIQSRDDIARFKPCRHVTGDVYISTLTLEDLHGLEGLQFIDGQLKIEPMLPENLGIPLPGKSSLTTLSGLDGLISVGGLDLEYLNVPTLAPLAQLQSAQTLQIVALDGLKDLRGLDNAVWTSALIAENAQLVSLNGLFCPSGAFSLELSQDPKLQDVAALSRMQGLSQLTLSNLPALDTLAGFKSLVNVNVISLDSCSAVSDLSGFGSLGSVGTITLSNNASLQTLMGLSTQHVGLIGIANCPRLQNLTGAVGGDGSIPDSFILSALPALKTLAGLETARTGQLLQIEQCDGLVDLSGLDQLETLDTLMISNCSGLQSFKGAGALKSIDQSFMLDRLPALASVAGMSKLAHVAMLQLSATSALPNLVGFDSLTNLSILYLDDNAALQNLKGLENLTYLDSVSLVNNSSLHSLDGLPMLDQLSGLLLDSNPLLSSLAGLGSYKALGAFTLTSSRALTGFEGLEQLGTISGDFSVVDNSALSSLHALKSLTQVNNLQFNGNERLPQCELNWLTQQTHSPEIVGDGPQGACP